MRWMSFPEWVERMATRALSDVSVLTIILDSGFYLTNTGTLVNAFFNTSNALWQSSDQI